MNYEGIQNRFFCSVVRRLYFIGTVAAAWAVGWACSFDSTGIPAVSQNNNNINTNINNNTNTHAVCGNNIIEPGEICDGNDVGGESCETQGYGSGTLRCRPDCQGFDASDCEGFGPICGNNVKEGSEICDGDDLGGETCDSIGFDGGQLACTQSCEFDTSGCFVCGDGVKNGSEVCDGDDLGGETCSSLGLYSGDLKCLPNCSGYDTSQCLFSQECGRVDLPVSDYNEVVILSVSIDGGDNVAFVSAGEDFLLSVSYTIEDCGCPGCINQIEIGFVPGDAHIYCAYDGLPGCGSPVSGTTTRTVAAPSTPGHYDIRFSRRHDYGCFHTHSDWWSGTPPESRTIGKICVTD